MPARVLRDSVEPINGGRELGAQPSSDRLGRESRATLGNCSPARVGISAGSAREHNIIIVRRYLAEVKQGLA